MRYLIHGLILTCFASIAFAGYSIRVAQKTHDAFEAEKATTFRLGLEIEQLKERIRAVEEKGRQPVRATSLEGETFPPI
jgi:hypothetical protein